MRALAVILLLGGCVQTPAAQLELNEKRVEVLPPEQLVQAPRAVPGTSLATGELGALVPGPQAAHGEPWVAELGALAPPPKLAATSASTFSPMLVTSISAVRLVTVTFELIGAEGAVAHEFVGPSGAPYAREELELQGSAFDAHHLELVLPVAGTAIDTARLSGTWTARLLVNGAVLQSHSFELTP